MSDKPYPVEIKLHQQSRTLELSYSDGATFNLPCEYLRVFSPSAEVRGHSPDQAVLQVGKRNVSITDIRPIGNYEVKMVFEDLHDTGLYSWDYLYDLGRNHDIYWRDYLGQLAAAGGSGRPAGPALAAQRHGR